MNLFMQELLQIAASDTSKEVVNVIQQVSDTLTNLTETTSDTNSVAETWWEKIKIFINNNVKEIFFGLGFPFLLFIASQVFTHLKDWYKKRENEKNLMEILKIYIEEKKTYLEDLLNTEISNTWGKLNFKGIKVNLKRVNVTGVEEVQLPNILVKYDDNEIERKSVSIIGMSGAGKSILVKMFIVDSINNDFSPQKLLPVLIEASEINLQNNDLTKLITKKIIEII